MVVAKFFGLLSFELGVWSQDVGAGMELPPLSTGEPVEMPVEMPVGAPEIPMEVPTLPEMPMGVPMGMMGTPMGAPIGIPLQDPQMMPLQYDMPPLQYDMPMQYGTPTQYMLPPEMQMPSMPPSYEQPWDMQFASPELQPSPYTGRKSVTDLGLKPLELGQMVCAQAQSGQWWTAEVFHDNMDYTYFLLVQDDVLTQWPRVHWADVLDRSCPDFYQAELDKAAQQQEIQQEAHQDFQEDPQQQQQQDPNQEFQIQEQELPPQEPPQEPEEPKETGRWSAEKKKKKRPWGVISAAAVAGSVPILYHLSGPAGPAA